MSYKEIMEDIKKDRIKNMYLFYGEETCLIDYVLKRLKTKLIDPSFEQLNFRLISGREASYEKIIDACETLPFMAEKRLVYLDGLDIFKERSELFSEKEEKQFIEYISRAPKSTIIVFYGNSSIDGRKKIVKQIKKYSHVAEFTKLKEVDLNRWIISVFKESGKSIRPGELALFKNNLDYLGRNPSQNLLDVRNEIKKIISFMGEKTNLEKEHIDRVMGSNFHNDIFNLLDSIEKHNYPESVKRLSHMLEDNKEPILKILTTMGNQIKNTLSSKLLTEKGYSDKEIASKLKIHPYVASKCAIQGRKFTIKRLRELLNSFLEADIMIKSGTMDEKLVMEMLILKICQQ